MPPLPAPPPTPAAAHTRDRKKQRPEPLIIFEMADIEDREVFMEKLVVLNRRAGKPIRWFPKVGHRPLDLYRLFLEVMRRGGCDEVTRTKQWKSVADCFSFPQTVTSASYVLKNHYLRFLKTYEDHYFETRGLRPPPPPAKSKVARPVEAPVNECSEPPAHPTTGWVGDSTFWQQVLLQQQRRQQSPVGHGHFPPSPPVHKGIPQPPHVQVAGLDYSQLSGTRPGTQSHVALPIGEIAGVYDNRAQSDAGNAGATQGSPPRSPGGTIQAPKLPLPQGGLVKREADKPRPGMPVPNTSSSAAGTSAAAGSAPTSQNVGPVDGSWPQLYRDNAPVNVPSPAVVASLTQAMAAAAGSIPGGARLGQAPPSKPPGLPVPVPGLPPNATAAMLTAAASHPHLGGKPSLSLPGIDALMMSAALLQRNEEAANSSTVAKPFIQTAPPMSSSTAPPPAPVASAPPAGVKPPEPVEKQQPPPPPPAVAPAPKPEHTETVSTMSAPAVTNAPTLPTATAPTLPTATAPPPPPTAPSGPPPPPPAEPTPP